MPANRHATCRDVVVVCILCHDFRLTAGMSDISCDRVVIVNEHLSPGTLDDVYMYVGEAPRLANDYTSDVYNGVENFTLISEPDRGEK